MFVKVVRFNEGMYDSSEDLKNNTPSRPYWMSTPTDNAIYTGDFVYLGSIVQVIGDSIYTLSGHFVNGISYTEENFCFESVSDENRLLELLQ